MDYLILSMVLMAIGVYGLLTKYRFLKMVVSIEILAIAATMNFVLLVSAAGIRLGESLLILAFSTDICVSSVVVALLVIVSRKYGTTDIRELARIVRDRAETPESEQKISEEE
jgi:NADH-quinone oxidoreductase subunit K